MSAVVQGPRTPYAFSNDQPTAGDLLRGLGQMLDPFTRTRLAQAGIRPGARCLEVGAGSGSIAVWLAGQVGPGGTVIATDIRPQHIPDHPGLTVIEHNIVSDPLPDGPFDVIHVRAVLQHLPQRHEVLERLAEVLAPGGVLLVEELEARWSTAVLATPDWQAYEIFARYETAMSAVLTAAGNDPGWARQVHGCMRDLGLIDVTTEGWQGSWRGGTGSCLLAYAGSTEMHDRLVAAGMAAADLDTLRVLAMDPRMVLRGILLLSTCGRKPEPTGSAA